MATYILRSGTHNRGDKQYEVGDEVESDAPLHKLFRNKFDKVTYGEKPKSKKKTKKDDLDRDLKKRSKRRGKERKAYRDKTKRRKSDD